MLVEKHGFVFYRISDRCACESSKLRCRFSTKVTKNTTHGDNRIFHTYLHILQQNWVTKLDGVFQCPQIVRLLQVNYFQTLKKRRRKRIRSA